VKISRLFISIFVTALLLTVSLLPLAHLRRAYAGSPVAAQAASTVNISPTVIVEIVGGGLDYSDAVQDIPYSVGGGDLAALALDTTEIVVETEDDSGIARVVAL
jgi:hypothetical protein